MGKQRKTFIVKHGQLFVIRFVGRIGFSERTFEHIGITCGCVTTYMVKLEFELERDILVVKKEILFSFSNRRYWKENSLISITIKSTHNYNHIQPYRLFNHHY